MSRLCICVVLLTLFGTLSAEEQMRYDDELPPETARFGFYFFDYLRKYFCNSSFCMSADTMPYAAKLMCAAKCPELYLPHGTTTPESASPTASPMTTQTTAASTITTSTIPPTTPTTSPATSPTSPATSPTTTTTTTTTTTLAPPAPPMPMPAPPMPMPMPAPAPMPMPMPMPAPPMGG